nr:cytosolic sulfotransferase 15-like [Ipomoea trifida]
MIEATTQLQEGINVAAEPSESASVDSSSSASPQQTPLTPSSLPGEQRIIWILNPSSHKMSRRRRGRRCTPHMRVRGRGSHREREMENKHFPVEEKWWGDQNLQQINGFWFMPMITPAIQQAISEFKPHPNDVIVASFPKTGTTWVKSLVFAIINYSSLDSLVKNSPHDLIPFIENDVYGESSKSSFMSNTSCDTTRIFNTHIPYQLLGKNFEASGCRVVYITRNPKDTLNSLWHFVNKWKMTKEAPWEMEEAVEKFCQGIIPDGPYYEHVLGYRTASLKNPDKVFFITYEELRKDTVTHVKRLAEFLGCPVAKDNKKVEEIVKSCSFEVLSNHEINKRDELLTWFPVSKNAFFRQGTVGDHKKYLNEEAIKRIDALTREKFHECGFIYGI